VVERRSGWRTGGGHPVWEQSAAVARRLLSLVPRFEAHAVPPLGRGWFGGRALVFRPALGGSLHFATSLSASSRSLRRAGGGRRVLPGHRSFVALRS
jgi:hypothetical protein